MSPIKVGGQAGIGRNLEGYYYESRARVLRVGELSGIFGSIDDVARFKVTLLTLRNVRGGTVTVTRLEDGSAPSLRINGSVVPSIEPELSRFSLFLNKGDVLSVGLTWRRSLTFTGLPWEK